ncbi:MAG TPA: NnrS family protein [Gammaproteobacteria bacterium]|nr:NnrS family protein [Gammaproteobacteria bacterium]
MSFRAHPVWALGFRPFFLLAALAAVVWMPLWSLIYAAVLPLPMHFSAPVWHGHEMIFGFTAAVIAGFLLTAVPNWTGVPGQRGGILVALSAIWLAGRAVMLLSGWLPAWLVAIVDTAFFPAVVWAIRPSLVAAGKARNFLFPRVLLALAAVDMLIHLGGMRMVPIGEEVGLKAAIDLVTLLMVVMGGRVVPSFTANAVGSPPRQSNWTDRWSLYAMLVLTGLEFAPVMAGAQGLAALAAGVVNAWRMRGWQTIKTAGQPILWVLHLGYAWVVIGLLLKAAALLTDWVRWQDAIHGLTAGAIGTFTLGMMSRVALGHTGRPLKVRPVIAIAYLMISLAAILRIITPVGLSAATIVAMTHVASCLWAGAFLIYLIVYAPMLLRPRADGRPG